MTQGIARSSMALLLALLIACKGSTPASVSVKTADAPSPADSAAAEALRRILADETDNAVAYHQEGKRDPFRSLVHIAEKTRVPDPSLPPLERVEIREMRLTGVVWSDSGYQALIQVPDGKGYGAEIGTRMGLDGGIVSRITTKDIVIEERSVDIFGKTHVARHVLDLYPKMEGVE